MTETAGSVPGPAGLKLGGKSEKAMLPSLVNTRVVPFSNCLNPSVLSGPEGQTVLLLYTQHDIQQFVCFLCAF